MEGIATAAWIPCARPTDGTRVRRKIFLQFVAAKKEVRRVMVGEAGRDVSQTDSTWTGELVTYIEHNLLRGS
jgi:hypothetical protein